MTIDTGCERDVGVATQSFALTSPLHHDTHCGIGILFRTANLPPQGVLVGHGCSTGAVHVVLTASATTHHDFCGPCGDVGVRILVGAEDVPCPLDACIAISQKLLGTVDVSLRNDTARMYETMIVGH